jgi:hypothetical protein
VGEELGPWNGNAERECGIADDDSDGAASGLQASVGLALSPAQKQVYDAHQRFRVLVAGRRFGKSFLAVPELFRMARGYWHDGSDREAWYVSPTYKQARRDLWRPLKRILGPVIATRNETTMSVTLAGGGRISLHGADSYDSLRGAGLNGLVLDEYADIAPEAWKEALRPMLSDRLGSALFIGTPEGFNHFYDLWSEAKSSKSGWAAWQFTTLQGGNVTPEEIDDARRDLDEKTFRQEYEASFENYAGRAYYAFDRTQNVHPVAFDPRYPLCWSLDFNIDPMAAVVCQVVGGDVRVLQEIVLPESSTPHACEVFRERVQPYLDIARGNQIGHVPVPVRVYGDPAGNHRSHAGADRSDWNIVKSTLAEWRNLLPSEIRVSSADPGFKARVNAVNAMLCNSHGVRRLIINPSCKELIADFEKVGWKTDTSGNPTGELDKDGDKKRTHVSDALAYFIEKEFGLKNYGGPRSSLLI